MTTNNPLNYAMSTSFKPNVTTNNPGLNYTMNTSFNPNVLTPPSTLSQRVFSHSSTPPLPIMNQIVQNRISPSALNLSPDVQARVDAYRRDVNRDYQIAEEVRKKSESFACFIADLENISINQELLVTSFRQQVGNELFRKICEEVSLALKGNKNVQTGEQLLKENFRAILCMKDYDGRSLLDQIAAYYAYQLENYRGRAELNNLGGILEKHCDLLQRASTSPLSMATTMCEEAAKLKLDAIKTFQSLHTSAMRAVCKRIYELDGGGAKSLNYGYETALNDIQRTLSYKGACPIKDAAIICAENSAKAPEFNVSYLHAESVKPTDSQATVREIKKLYELEDLKHFLNDPYKSNDFLASKYKKLSSEVSYLLNQIILLADYQPIELGSSENFISKHVRILLKIKNQQGEDVISQLIAHQQEKIKGLRLAREVELFVLDSANQSPPQLLQLFNRLNGQVKDALRERVWKRDGGEKNPDICGWKDFFGRWGYYGTRKIEADPKNALFQESIQGSTTPLILEYLNELKAKIAAADNVLLHDLKSSKSIPEAPIDVSSSKLEREPDLIKKLPPNLRVAYVTTELAGVANIGGLASAVDGMTRGFGVKDARVIMPLYLRKGDNGNGPIPETVLRSITHKSDYDLELNGKKHRIYSTRVNGIKCYFIDDPELFSIPPKEDGAAGNFYNGDYLTVKRRWAVFQSAAADLVYKLSKKRNPVQLVHVHDSQTALVPKFLATRHPEEWERGETPATMFTFHNNHRHSGAYEHRETIDILQQQGLRDLPSTGVNSFIEGLYDADVSTTVSETFGKEAQTKVFGNRMDPHVKRAALNNRLFAITNGNSNGWDPTKDEQLQNWVSVQGANRGTAPDLRFGPKSLDLVEKIKTCQLELCAYLKGLPFDHAAYADLDPTKPIITYIGRLDFTQKGINELFFIMKEALKNDCQFVCVGTEPDEEAQKLLNIMKQYAKERGKKGVLILEDRKENGKLKYQGVFGSILRAATSMATLPSIYEPCGLVQGEFNRLGKKVIATRTGGFADTLKTEGPDANGYLFKRCDDWWTAEQENEIGKTLNEALVEAKAMHHAFYRGDANAQKPYADSMRTIMHNALNSTWEKTPDGSLSPIRLIELAMAKALEYRKERNRSRISANLHTLKI